MHTADQAERDRLGQHRDDHRDAAETECAQGRDLAAAAGDSVVHRVHRAEDRADAHQAGDRETNGADHGLQRLRLPRVILRLADAP